LDKPKLAWGEKHAIDVPHQIGIFGNFTTVYPYFALIFVDERLYGNLAVPIFRFRDNFSTLLAHFNQLFVVANSKRRTRAKIENRLGAVGLALGVFAKENVQALFKEEILALVVSKILQE
jgi:hypothetical protein